LDESPDIEYYEDDYTAAGTDTEAEAEAGAGAGHARGGGGGGAEEKRKDSLLMGNVRIFVVKRRRSPNII
jgi:hypothetical protein